MTDSALPTRFVVTPERLLVARRLTTRPVAVIALPHDHVSVVEFRRGLPLGQRTVLVLDVLHDGRIERFKLLNALEGRLNDLDHALRTTPQRLAKE